MHLASHALFFERPGEHCSREVLSPGICGCSWLLFGFAVSVFLLDAHSCFSSTIPTATRIANLLLLFASTNPSSISQDTVRIASPGKFSRTLGRRSHVCRT